MRRTRLALLSLLVTLLIPALTVAEGRNVWTLGLQPPAEILATTGDAQQAFARVAADRLRTRLTAAGIKEFNLTVTNASTLRLETGVDRERGWMDALLTAPGKLEIRPVATKTPNWLELAKTLPAGIEIRGEESPWLWSAQRSALEGWLRRVTLAGVVVKVQPGDDGGFRTLSLAGPVATEADVRTAQTRQSAVGGVYVEITLEPRSATRLAALPDSGVEQFAIVLDGEVIAVVHTASLREDSRLRISVPRGAVADNRQLRDAWVHQVAGRLAAPIPVSIAVLKE